MNAREFLRAMYEAITGEYPHRQPAPMELLQLIEDNRIDVQAAEAETADMDEQRGEALDKLEKAEGRIEELEAELAELKAAIRNVRTLRTQLDVAIDALRDVDDLVGELEEVVPKEEPAESPPAPSPALDAAIGGRPPTDPEASPQGSVVVGPAF